MQYTYIRHELYFISNFSEAERLISSRNINSIEIKNKGKSIYMKKMYAH